MIRLHLYEDVVMPGNNDQTVELRPVREQIVQHLLKESDPKKVLSFLSRCGVIEISADKKEIIIGVPNEFVLTQVKKFFHKAISQAVQDTYNPAFKPIYRIHQDFQGSGDIQHALLVDMKKMLPKQEKTQLLQPEMKKKLSEFFGILFEGQYQFENFVVGSHNNLAHSAAQAVASKPGEAYNPLFIYGQVGLGKTHLMQAIGNAVIKKFPEKVVVYLPTSKLIDEIIDAIQKKKLTALIKKFEQVDVLLLDDVQFLADKEKTQEIFYTLFNDFHAKKKQIVLSSDRPPIQLNGIEPRLKSRFAFGLVVDVQAPDYETRVAILQSKVRSKQIDLPSEVLHQIAQVVKDNVRELEGALNSLVTRQQLSAFPLNSEEVGNALKTLGYQVQSDPSIHHSLGEVRLPDPESLLKLIGDYYQIHIDDLLGDKRTKEVSQTRQLVMFIFKKKYGRTLEKIGEYFGGKTHATVIYGLQTVEKAMKQDPALARDYEVICQQLGMGK